MSDNARHRPKDGKNSSKFRGLKRNQLTSPLLIVGTPEKCADLLYLTGFQAPDPVAFLKVRGRRLLVVSRMEFGRARKTAKRGTVVLTPDDLPGAKGALRGIGDWALGLVRHARVRRVVVPEYFPAGTEAELRRHGIRIDVAAGAVCPAREVKSTAELAKIAGVQRAAVYAFRRAAALIRVATVGRDGVLRLARRTLTAGLVRAEINRALIEHECFGRDVIVAGGEHAVDPHDTGSGPLHAGEPIVIDIFPQHIRHGYWGDLTRTLIKGKPAPAVRRMYAAVRDAQQVGLRSIHAGARAERIHAAVAAELERHGFRNGMVAGRRTGFIHGTGHGVGLEIHERPVIGAAPVRLRAGQVVTVEPGLYYPRLGGIRIEDTVVVTRRGCRILAACPHVFECGGGRRAWKQTEARGQ